MDKSIWWSQELRRPGQRRQSAPSRWAPFWKALIGFSAVLALMSAVLYADIWLRQENLVEAVAAGD
jgi:hypothetical protein